MVYQIGRSSFALFNLKRSEIPLSKSKLSKPVMIINGKLSYLFIFYRECFEYWRIVACKRDLFVEFWVMVLTQIILAYRLYEDHAIVHKGRLVRLDTFTSIEIIIAAFSISSRD